MAEDVRGDAPPGDVAHDRAARESTDATELVGPGRYPLRIQPAAALMPGASDARRLLIVWFVRKSFYWLFFLGWGVGTLVAYWSRGEVEPDIDLTSPSSIREALFSPWVALLFALIIRFVSSWAALALAYPLAVAHEPGLADRRRLGRLLDRRNVARAFRALRWTHDVRQIALGRLGSGNRLRKLDPILDVVNVVSGIVCFGLVFYVASQLN